MWELLVAESTPREAATCNGGLIVQLCTKICVEWKPFHKQHHLSGTRSLSMPLDTGFRRQQSTCLDVFSVGRIHSKTSSSNSSCLFQLNSLHSNHHQSWVFLPVPGQGRDGRECDAHLHHRCQPAKALCPVRPGCTRGVRYIDKPYRLSIYRHFLKISI